MRGQVGDWYYEIAIGTFMVWYIINIFLGKRRNEEIALTWARAFACDGGLLERNFALLSPGALATLPLSSHFALHIWLALIAGIRSSFLHQVVASSIKCLKKKINCVCINT